MTRQIDTNNWQYGEEKQLPQRLKSQQSVEIQHRNMYPLFTVLKVYYKWLLMLSFSAAMVSIPWEFMRLYQKAVAERASRIVQGAPPECSPENLTLFERIKSLLVAQFSWTHAQDPCREYYYALLVDPLWEVTPAMVLISAFTRCCLHPLELISTSLGYSLQLFFSEIPLQWQPFIFLVASVIIFVILVMLCGYRLTIPLILRLESRSPLHRQTYMKNNIYQEEIALKNNRNTNCYERTYSPLGETVSKRNSLQSLSRISTEPVLNQNNYLQVSKPGEDCRSNFSQKDTFNNTSVQSNVYGFNKKCVGGLGRSITKKRNGRDSWELPVSEILTGKIQKEKHQIHYTSRTVVARNVTEKDKRTVFLRSRKCNIIKHKSKPDTLWTPTSEDCISSDSE